MPTVVKYKPAKNSTMRWVILLVLISLLLNAAIIFVLFQVRNISKGILLQAAADIETLSTDHFQTNIKINQTIPIATEVTIDDELVVPVSMVVNNTLPIKTEIPFNDELAIPLNLSDLGDSVPISTTVAFNQVITVPISVELDKVLPALLPAPLGQDIEVPLALNTGQVLPINSRVLLDQAAAVPINLSVNQEFMAATELFGQAISVPVTLDVSRVISASATLVPDTELSVPLDFSLEGLLPANTTTELGATSIKTTDRSVIIPIPSADEIVTSLPATQRTVQFDMQIPINQEFPIQTNIPLNLPFGDEFKVQINKNIPIDMQVPINLPIETELTVPINLTVPIAMEVPVAMDVPIDIALTDTPFGGYLQSLSDRLRLAVSQY